ALEVAMIDREHHGAPGPGIEYARQPVLHAPVELVRALEKESRRGLRRCGGKALSFGVGFRHGAPRVVGSAYRLVSPRGRRRATGAVIMLPARQSVSLLSQTDNERWPDKATRPLSARRKR